jgi:Class II flagellar assembly regulator
MTMRIYGPNGTTLGTPASNARRTGSTGFSLPDTTAVPDEVRSAAAPKAAGNIDALLALQGVEDPVERRKRSVARGKGALDVLDELKIGLLSGNLDASTVSRLRHAAANLKSSSGDPGLDSVLSEIELRVEVELAKAGQASSPQPGKGAELDLPVALGAVRAWEPDRQVPPGG